MGTIISVNNISKKYKTQDVYSLKDLSLEVEEGEIIGVLGPNGAGKSTFIKSMLGIISTTSGSIEVLGKNPLKFRNAEKRQIGVFLGGKTNLVFHLPVIDSVRLFQKIYKVKEEDFNHNLEKYSKILQCESFLKQRVSTLSLGQKVRAELLCLLIYEPKLLVLDEPTLGLDIEGKKVVRDILRQLVEEKKMTVLITTHDVSDMERLCSRILMIKKGEKILDISDEEFEKTLKKYTIIVADCEIQVDDSKILEYDGKAYRYLVKKENLQEFKKILYEKETMFINEETPRLEDLFYEYYC